MIDITVSPRDAASSDCYGYQVLSEISERPVIDISPSRHWYLAPRWYIYQIRSIYEMS